MNKYLSRGKQIISNVKTHWKTPAPGNYMNYREISSLAVGGMGVKFIITFIQASLVSVGNIYVGNTIGIKPGPMYVIYLISVLSSFPLTALRANIVDNTRSRKGKYRPYIISMGLPTVILSLGYVWTPYERMSDLGKYAAVLFFNIGFQFFYNFLYDAYDNYVVVLSSNTQERANVLAIRAVTDSFAPTLTNAIIPLMGKVITGTDNLFDMRIYRIIWPPILIVGFLMSLIIYVNTREKIVQARTHVVQIKFTDAFRAVFRNKYFWIISIAGWLGFLEYMAGNILAWLYTYQHACDEKVYTILIAIYGNASFWGMLAAPFAIKRIGKRNTLIFTNILNIFFIAAMYPVVKHSDPKIMIWLVMGCLWMNALVSSFSHVLTPSINGDIRDYQQYITGERIDGMFAAVGLIGSVVTMATTSIQSFIYTKVGFNDAKLHQLLPIIEKSGEHIADKTNVYNVLYDRETFISIFGVLILTAALGAAMNVIPYFFYDLSEVRQQGMVKVLKIRAAFEDSSQGLIDKESLEEVRAIIEEARSQSDKEPRSLSGLSGRKKREAVEYNNEIEISRIVLNEIEKYSTPRGVEKLKLAEATAEKGLDGVYSADDAELKKVRSLPKSTPEEKEYRKEEIRRVKDSLYAKKIAAKYYPNGIVPFDMEVFDKLFEESDKINAEIDENIVKMHEIREKSENVSEISGKLKLLKKKLKETDRLIKKATDENSRYTRAAKPYLDAVKIIKQAENYAVALDEQPPLSYNN